MWIKFKKNLIRGISLSSEGEFIIRHLRRIFSGNGGAEQIDQLSPFINTNTAFETSRAWGITPMLFNALNKLDTIQPSTGGKNGLIELTRNDYLRTSLINKGNYEKLTVVLAAFRAAGIKVILLKGIHLAKFVYRDIGLRPMSDVDILLKKEDIEKAEKIMFDLGYKYSGSGGSAKDCSDTADEANMAKLPELYYELYKIRHHHFRHFTKPAGGIRVLEIHWTIMEPRLPVIIDTEGIWDRAETVKIDNEEVLVLSPEDLLLYLCLHISCSHHFKIFGLKPFCDIAFTVNHYSDRLDWEELGRRARKWNAERYLYLTLLLLKEILIVSLPESLLQSLNSESLNERVILQAKERILLTDDKWTIPKIERLSSEKGPVRQASHIFTRLFFPPKKTLASTYSISESSFRIYLYYFVRLISLLYHKTPLYARLFLFLLTHKKTDFHKFNLDSWLIQSDSDK
jgi:hypothetical protein